MRLVHQSYARRLCFDNKTQRAYSQVQKLILGEATMTQRTVCTRQLDALFQQALFFSTMHYVGNCPLTGWLRLLMSTARGWHKIGEFTAYLHAHQKLQFIVFSAIALHPQNAPLLPLDHVIHPAMFVLDDDELREAEGKSWPAWYRDVVVDWFEQAGVKTRIAIDLTDLIMDNMDIARDFYNTLMDPLESYQEA